MSRQEQQLKQILKLMSGKDRKDLTDFLQSGQAPGSKAFKKLKANVQKNILKMNITSVEIIIKRSRNPFTKLRYLLAKISYNGLLKTTIKEQEKSRKKK